MTNDRQAQSLISRFALHSLDSSSVHPYNLFILLVSVHYFFDYKLDPFAILSISIGHRQPLPAFQAHHQRVRVRTSTYTQSPISAVHWSATNPRVEHPVRTNIPLLLVIVTCHAPLVGIPRRPNTPPLRLSGPD